MRRAVASFGLASFGRLREIDSVMRNSLIVTGTLLFTAACGEPKPAEVPPTAGTAAEVRPKGAAAKPTDDQPAKALALETLTQEESSKGACDPEHQAALEKLRAEIDAAMQTKAGDDGKPLPLKPIFNRVVALGPNAKALEISLQGSLTQAHVLAYSAKDISIDVLVGTTAATTMRSPFQRTVLPKPVGIELAKAGKIVLESDSRQLELEKGQPLKVKMTGQGCALVVGYMKP